MLRIMRRSCNCITCVAVAVTIFVVATVFASCKTTSSVSEKYESGDKTSGEIEIVEANKDIALPKNVYFIDWEYRGFGRELPDWVEPAFIGGAENVKRECARFSDVQVFVVSAYGMNPDQVVRKLFAEITQANIGEQFAPIETLWVRLVPDKVDSRGEYIAFQLYVASDGTGY